MKEKENVIRILKESKLAIEKKDVVKLKELSDQTIHTASTTQDPDNVAIAVIVYSLSKIIERQNSLEKCKKFCKEVVFSIEGLLSALKTNDQNKIKIYLEKLRNSLNKAGNVKSYIQDVFRKAAINKASKIYEHGISMEQTAKLLGITVWELAGYAGQKVDSSTEQSKTTDVKKRIKIAMEIFG